GSSHGSTSGSTGSGVVSQQTGSSAGNATGSSASSGSSSSSGSDDTGGPRFPRRSRRSPAPGSRRPAPSRGSCCPRPPPRPPRAGGQWAAASWRGLGRGVGLLVTELRALGPARRLLREDLAALDAACSRFRADSEILALDHAPGDGRGRTGPVQVSPLLAGALAVALRAARLTGDGAGPPVNAA